MLAPADEYVAEFVRHMNPLDVLTGSMIMRDTASLAAEGGALWLDANRHYRLFLDAQGGLLDIQVDGRPQTARVIGGAAAGAAAAGAAAAGAAAAGTSAGGAAAPVGLAIAPASSSLQEIIQFCRSTGHPVLLAEDRRILGVCGEAEIIRALAGSRASRAT